MLFRKDQLNGFPLKYTRRETQVLGFCSRCTTLWAQGPCWVWEGKSFFSLRGNCRRLVRKKNEQAFWERGGRRKLLEKKEMSCVLLRKPDSLRSSLKEIHKPSKLQELQELHYPQRKITNQQERLRVIFRKLKSGLWTVIFSLLLLTNPILIFSFLDCGW